MRTLFKISGRNVLLMTLFAIVIVVFVAPFGLKADDVKVKVVVPGPGSAFIENIPSGTEIVAPSACVTPEFLDRYFHGSASEYDASLSPQARCAQGSMGATLLTALINDIDVGVSAIDDRRARLADTANYLKSFSEVNLDGLSLTAIPAGEIGRRKHRTASGLVMQCLRPGPVSSPVVAVGTPRNYIGSFFDEAPQSALRELPNLIVNYKEFAKIVKSWIGKTEIGKMKRMAQIVQENQKIVSANFILVIGQRRDENNYLSSSFNWALKDGKRNTIKIPFLIKKVLDKFLPDVPSQITAMDMSGTVSLNGVVDGVTLQDYYSDGSDGWLPETDVYGEFLSSIQAHTIKYQKMKSDLKKEKDNLVKQLDTLTKNNFNCN